MNEKKIIEGELINIKKVFWFICAIGIVLGTIAVVNRFKNPFYVQKSLGYKLAVILPCSLSYSMLPFVIIAFIVYHFASKTNITVTNKRVYGTTILGKKINLPIDSISSISLSKFGISIATSSGNIEISGIKNCTSLYDEISKLLLERQERKNNK